MTKKVKAKWVAALRSGEYKQGQYALRTRTNDFCCLGVLCDIIDPTGWVKNDCEPFEYQGELTALPRPLRRELRISVAMADKLVEMNDNYDDFDRIADYIEKEL